jgi:hypothetical protein
MPTVEILHEPSANLSLPGLRVVYTPTGLAYTFSPPLFHSFTILRAQFSCYLPPLVHLLVFCSIVFWLHSRLSALETASTSHRQHTTNALKTVSDILRTMLRLHTTTQADTAEHLRYLTCFVDTAIEMCGADIDRLAALCDADLGLIDARINLQGRMILAVENNFDQARCILAGMVSDGAGSDGGLKMGDDVEKFWPAEDDEAGSDLGAAVEEVEIDVEACNQQVWVWLVTGCVWPEECEDIFEEV